MKEVITGRATPGLKVLASVVGAMVTVLVVADGIVIIAKRVEVIHLLTTILTTVVT